MNPGKRCWVSVRGSAVQLLPGRAFAALQPDAIVGPNPVMAEIGATSVSYRLATTSPEPTSITPVVWLSRLAVLPDISSRPAR